VIPAKRCTLILSAVAFFVMMGSTIISPILPLYALTFGVTLAMVGGLISGYGIARLVLDIPSGVMASRVGMKRFMLVGVMIVILGAFISGSAPNYWVLLVGRVLEGVGSAIYTTTSFTCMGIVAPVDERGKYMSFYLGFLLLGTVMGPAVGGVIADHLGLRAPFFVYSLITFFSFLLVLVGIDASLFQKYSRGNGKGFVINEARKLINDYTFLSINTAIFSIFFVRIGVISTLFPIFGAFNVGLDEFRIGLLLTTSALFNFVTMLIAGPLTDRYGRKPFMFSSLLFTGVFVAMIPLAGDFITLLFIMSAIGIALGLSGPIMAWVTDVAGGPNLGTAMGIFRTMSDAGFVTGPIVLTLLAGTADHPVDNNPFILAAAVIILSSILLLKGKDPIMEYRRR